MGNKKSQQVLLPFRFSVRGGPFSAYPQQVVRFTLVVNLYVADQFNSLIRIGTTNTCPDQPTIDLAAGQLT